MLYFAPDETLLVESSSRKLCRGASSRAAPSATEDETVPPLLETPLLLDTSIPDLVFLEPPEGYEDDSPMFRRYMVSTMRSMWQLIASGVSHAQPTSSPPRPRSPLVDPRTPRSSDDDFF